MILKLFFCQCHHFSVVFMWYSGAGVGVVDIGIVDPAGQKDTIRPLVARKSDDVWYVEYIPLVEGLHSVNIFFAGKPIPNSPYPVAVSRGRT